MFLKQLRVILERKGKEFSFSFIFCTSRRIGVDIWVDEETSDGFKVVIEIK